MKILTITCENEAQIQKYSSAGADELIVALNNGCFSSMHGFTAAEIQHICQENPKRTAVLMNRLFNEEEKQWAAEMLTEILMYADAVFFADPALMYQACRLQKQDQMIYRPETLLTSSEDAAWWMAQGLQSVQISPLLTAEEICEIASGVPHASLQIHGRLLMSVSKRRLLTAYAEINQLTGLAGKKDLYLREESREGMMPVYENAFGTMIYTDYIQESFGYISRFMNAGIERFEIDTNGLREEEITDAVSIYRSLLNGKAADSTAYLTKYRSLPLSTGYYGQKTVK